MLACASKSGKSVQIVLPAVPVADQDDLETWQFEVRGRRYRQSRGTTGSGRP